MHLINNLIRFINTDIWRIRARKLPRSQSFLINQLRIFLLAFHGFNEDKCQLRASALTFYSLLSIVPVLAMAFGIAKGFGLDKMLETQILAKMPGQEQVVGQMIGYANVFLENAKGGIIAGVGVALLFWTVIKVLGNIENCFNEIWGVQKERTLSRKFSDYLSIMLICPILIVASSSVTVLVTSQVTFLISKLSFLGPVADIILFIMKFLPFCVMWVLFTFIYIFMPNTRVNFRSGLIGGIIAGTIYQTVQWVYITFQVGVSSYGAIYGSFAALPLFLVWLQISWLIVLFGAEISFAEQNVDTYEYEPDSLRASASFKKMAALSVAHLCIKRFDRGQAPLTASAISHELEMPMRLLQLVLFELTESGVLCEVKADDGKSVSYQPARDIEDLTIQAVSELMDNKGTSDIPFAQKQEINAIRESLESMNRIFKESAVNRALKDI